jgi:16S rRNA (guanine527-N7)-methyltransferase
MNTNELLKILQNGCEELHLHLSSEVQIKLIDYLLLLKKWNKTYNLTAIDDPRKMITHHLLDSLGVASYILGNNILDVGSGAGLPGIPLALALPQKHFVLLDSNLKKTRFLFHVVTTLKIANIEVVNQRVEMYNPKITNNFNGFDVIITRAFSAIQDMLNKTRHLYNANGCLLAMKGKIPTKEIENINKNVMVYNLTIPGLNEERHLVVIQNNHE